MNFFSQVCVALLLGCPACNEFRDTAAAAPPNILVIYADDLGYGDVSCYNPDRGRIPTPHIDRLAVEGMRFTDAHSSSSVCSPSRYTFLTGRYHWRTRLQSGIVGPWGEPLIAADRLTVAGMLQQQGYRTACIGKWHLGWDWPIEEGKESLFGGSIEKDVPATPDHHDAWRETFSQPIPGGPISRGFDEYFGTDVPNWPPFCFIEQDQTVGIPTEFLPARLFQNNQASLQGPALEGWTLEAILPALGDRASNFIARASEDDRPFFLYLPLTSPHTPLAVNRPWLGKSGLNLYADFVMETDALVGQVLAALEQHGVANNTLVLFTSDNGCAPYIGVAELQEEGHFPSGPLRGYKADVWEGGHRVPFLVRWPGHVKPGTVCEELVHQADLMATCAEIVGIELPPDVGEDSFSLLPLLRGGSTPVRQNSVSQSAAGLTSIRNGPWKLIFGSGSGGWSQGQDEHPAQLYHLEEDLAESENLYTRHPEIVVELTELMERLVDNGRSTPGPAQFNDVEVQWKRFLSQNTDIHHGDAVTAQFIIGADISWVQEQENEGIRFSDQGEQKDILAILKDYGFNSIRLRTFHSPRAAKGYSAKGYCDLEHTLAMAARVKEAGMGLLLNLHYSDTWADPGHQTKPEAWIDLHGAELERAVYKYTRDVMTALRKQETLPDIVQIGNEISNGFLWPDGQVWKSGDWGVLCGLIEAGIAGAKEVDPEVKIMIHLALGGQNPQSRVFLDRILAHGVDFDIIGQSYYPRWHGTLAELEANLVDLAERYDQDIMVVEYSVPNIREINDIVRNLPGNKGLGTFIWEPTKWQGPALFDGRGTTKPEIKAYRTMAEEYDLTDR